MNAILIAPVLSRDRLATAVYFGLASTLYATLSLHRYSDPLNGPPQPQRPILIAPVLSRDRLATAVCAHSTDTLSLNGPPLATSAHNSLHKYTLSRPPTHSGLRSLHRYSLHREQPPASLYACLVGGSLYVLGLEAGNVATRAGHARAGVSACGLHLRCLRSDGDDVELAGEEGVPRGGVVLLAVLLPLGT